MEQHFASEPPHTSREYAYFLVTGPSTHEAITERLGLTPSEAWNTGDINPRTKRPRKGMIWKLRSGLDDTRPLKEHIDTLLLWLGSRASTLRDLWVEHDLVLQCVGHYASFQGPGAHLDRETVRQAAQLGLAIDYDFYFVTFDDEE